MIQRKAGFQMLEEGRGRTKSELENEWCVSAYVKEGLSREEAEEKCAGTGRTGDTHVSGRRFAVDSEDSESLKACMAWRIGEGDTEEEAREYCESSGEKVPASDSSLGIVNRDPTPLERCMGCRMDIYGETEEQARRTCTKMFNDPMFKHTFSEGDAWGMGAALYKWEYDHSSKYESFRERDRQERKSMDRHVAEIINEIQSDSKDPDRFLPDVLLKKRAERIYRQRKEGKQIKATRKAREDRTTVGSLYGKTTEQIIREQAGDTSRVGKDIYRMDTPFKTPKPKATVGSLYMKTREQIIGEDRGYDWWTEYPELKKDFDKCVRQRMADGMTRGQAEAHCLPATLPSDEPGPHAKPLRKGPM